MSYRIEFIEEAADDWRRLDRSARKRLEKAIERLKKDPKDYGKPLGGPLHGLRRIRSGDFRVVYRIHEASKVVEVGVVCHRRDVYAIAHQRRLV